MRSFVLCTALLSALACCGPVKQVTHTVIDCARADHSALNALGLQLATSVIGDAPDWSSIERQAVAAGAEVGGCVLAELVQHYLTPTTGRAAPAVASGQAARAALERFRGEVAGGATFKTASGEL